MSRESAFTEFDIIELRLYNIKSNKIYTYSKAISAKLTKKDLRRYLRELVYDIEIKNIQELNEIMRLLK